VIAYVGKARRPERVAARRRRRNVAQATVVGVGALLGAVAAAFVLPIVWHLYVEPVTAWLGDHAMRPEVLTPVFVVLASPVFLVSLAIVAGGDRPGNSWRGLVEHLRGTR
jgi:hypothetical protein